MTVNVTPSARPGLGAEVGRERNREGRHHHSRHGQGKAAGGRSDGASEPARSKRANGSPLDVKVGDRILFGKYTGNDIKIDDQEYLILREEEILAKLGRIAKAASGKK